MVEVIAVVFVVLNGGSFVGGDRRVLVIVIGWRLSRWSLGGSERRSSSRYC